MPRAFEKLKFRRVVPWQSRCRKSDKVETGTAAIRNKTQQKLDTQHTRRANHDISHVCPNGTNSVTSADRQSLRSGMHAELASTVAIRVIIRLLLTIRQYRVGQYRCTAAILIKGSYVSAD
jgi:hypothetical protein